MSVRGSYLRRAARSAAWNHFAKLAEFGLLNVYTVLIARYFGPAGSVPYIVYTAAGTSLSIIGAIAVDGALLRYVPWLAESGANADELAMDGVHDLSSFIRKLFAFRLLVILVLACILLFSFLLLLFYSIESVDSFRSLLPFVSIFLIAQAIIAFSTFTLMSLMRTKVIFFSSLIARTVLVSTAGGLMWGNSISIEVAILLHLGSSILYAILLLIVLNQILRGSNNTSRFAISIRELFSFVRRPSSIKSLLLTPVMLYGLTTWGNDILSLLLGRQSDILLMRALLGEHAPDVGYYNVASLILLLTEYIFLLGLGGTLIGVFSKLAYDDERLHSIRSRYPSLNRGRSEVVAFQQVLLIPLCIFVFVFSFQILRVIYGSLYDNAVSMVQHGVLALVVNTAIFQGGLAITSLVVIGKQGLVFRNRVFWAVINLIANYFLIRSYGALGAIIGTNWANTLACATEWYYARKYIGPVGNFFSMMRITAIAVAGVAVAYGVSQLIEFQLGVIAAAMVPGAIFIGTTLSLFYLFRVPETTVVISRLKKAFVS